MSAQAAPLSGAGALDPGPDSVQPSLVDLIGELARDALDLLALETRAAALTLALLVFVSVAAACFALFAWFGLSAIGVVALVRAGHSLPVALSALAAVNAVMAIGAGVLAQRLTRSILFGEGGASRHEVPTEGHAHA